jgi:hypothetical protein
MEMLTRGSGTSAETIRNSSTLSSTTTTQNTPYLYQSLFDGTSNYFTIHKGSTTATGTVTSAATTGSFAISAYTIAREGTADPANFAGYISEVLVYNTYLSTTDRQRIEGYLSWKWGLQANLLSTHPYSTTNATLGAPTSLAATGGLSRVSVAFTEGAKAGVLTIVNYQYSTDGGATYTAFSPAQTASPLVITGLSNGTTYTVKLKAVALDGYIISAESSGVSATAGSNVGIKTDTPAANLDVNGTMRVVGAALVPTLTATTNLNTVATTVWASTSVAATHYNAPFPAPRVARVSGAAGGIYHLPAERDGYAVSNGAVVTVVAAADCTVVGSYVQDGTTSTVLSMAQIATYSQSITAGVAAEFYFYDDGATGGLWCRSK